MAQVSDVSIANQGFSAFRTELNNILAAFNTQHSGSSAPASLAAGSMWLDTSGGATSHILKFYDGTDHITFATVNTTANTIDFSDSSVTIADDSITLAKMASGTDGNIISYDASGNPVAVATGSAGQVLTSAGAGAPPTFATVSAGTSLSGSTNNTVATVTGANALIGEANLTFDGTDLAIASGNLNVANGYGIDFSATADGTTMGSEVLDDYEEGTWTGTISDGSNNATMSASGGVYTKIGDMVNVGGKFATSSLGSVSGNIRLTGLPFTVKAGATGYRPLLCFGENLNVSAGYTMGGHAEPSGTYANIFIWDAAGGMTAMTGAEWSADGTMFLNLTYTV